MSGGTAPDPSVTAATIPAAPAKLSLPTTATANVTSAADLISKLDSSTGGEVWVIPAGATYDMSTNLDLLRGKTYSSPVIVRSADMNNQAIITRTGVNAPTISSANANPTKKLTFYGIKFKNPATVANVNIGTITGCEDIRFSQCTFDGTGSVAGDNSYLVNGLHFFGCVRPIVDRCTFTAMYEGLFFQADGNTRTTDAYRGFNDYTNISEDSGRYAGVIGVRAEWEYHAQFFASVGAHCDTNQGNVSSPPSNVDGSGNPFNGTRHDGTTTLDQRNWDIRIQNCFLDFGNCTFVNGNKLFAQGPFLTDAWSTTETYQRIQVWDNQIWFPGNTGIQIDNVNDLDIQNNKIYRFTTAQYLDPLGAACHATMEITGADRVAILNNTYEQFISTGVITGRNNLTSNNTNVKMQGNTIDATDRTNSDRDTALTAWRAARSAAGL